jgi:HK97 gp10 family phage protein
MAGPVIAGNFAQVQLALASIIPRVEAADEVAEEAGAQIVAALAAAGAPRLTGHMAASVDEEGGVVVVDTPYAAYQEYGTRHHAAQPFLRPAKDRAEVPFRQSAERLYTIATR